MTAPRGLPYPADDDRAAQEFIARTVNLRQPHPRVWEQLHADDRIEQTTRVLTTIKHDAAARFTKRREDVDALRRAKNAGEVPRAELDAVESDYRQWHARAARFDQAVTQRLREAKAALKDRNRRVSAQERVDELDHWRKLLADLTEAVHHHQQAVHPDDAGPDDRLLWSRLDLIELPGDGGGGVLRDLIRKRIARDEQETA